MPISRRSFAMKFSCNALAAALAVALSATPVDAKSLRSPQLPHQDHRRLTTVCPAEDGKIYWPEDWGEPMYPKWEPLDESVPHTWKACGTETQTYTDYKTMLNEVNKAGISCGPCEGDDSNQDDGKKEKKGDDGKKEKEGGGFGDPHILKWVSHFSGCPASEEWCAVLANYLSIASLLLLVSTQDNNKYDFHGECDLWLLNNPDYNNGQGMQVQIRTKIERWWSYIESVAVKIGDDILEVHGGYDTRKYWVNRVEGDKEYVERSGTVMPFTLGGNRVRFRVPEKFTFQFRIFLEDNRSISIRSVKDMVRVDFVHGDKETYGSSSGLMGRYGDGAMVGRDGSTVLSDANLFGQEWQVLSSEEMLFHEPDGPQHPQKCIMPSTAGVSRRVLGESAISHDDAERACARHMKSSNADQIQDCISDVMATNDVDMASIYS